MCRWTEVIDWASQNVTSVLCSCPSTHALMKFLHGIDRVPLPRKQWASTVTESSHRRIRSCATSTRASTCRTRAITRFCESTSWRQACRFSSKVTRRASTPAVSEDGFRPLAFQGHPGDDANSLLKEYKREVLRHFAGERDMPPFPEHYISGGRRGFIEQFLREARTPRPKAGCCRSFPRRTSRHSSTTPGVTRRAPSLTTGSAWSIN